MPKEQYKETDVAKKISALTFGVESAESMQQEAHIEVVASNLYSNEGTKRNPTPYGVLDKRLGTLSTDDPCQTCGNTVTSCMGHFGYQDLAMPVYHWGYFTHIVNIMQSICNRCSRLLLPEEEKCKYRIQLLNENLNYTKKKVIRKKILEKCKKIFKCPYCGHVMGFTKKLANSKASNSFMSIVCERFRGRDKEANIEEFKAKFSSAIEANPEIQLALARNDINSYTPSPIEVQKLFERIPLSDIPFLGMNAKRAHPKDLILTRLLVPPVPIRPSVASDLRAGTTEDDLTVQQVKILKFCEQIRREKTQSMTEKKFLDCYAVLQYFVAAYFNSEVSGAPQILSTAGKTSGRGLVQRLKGKQGRFRGNLNGKRVDFSARTVISPDPNLEIDEVGVPLHIAKILTFPEKVNHINKEKLKKLIINGANQWPGANFVFLKGGDEKSLRYISKEESRRKLADNLKIGDTVERHVHDGDIVLFNRQPSLHRLSIMAHRVRVHKYKTFRFNECVCNPYNADFDGDEMNLHLPQTEEAKAEALILMGNKSNLMTPRNGELLIAATQDFLTGSFLLTRKDVFLDMDHAYQLAGVLIAGRDAGKDQVDLPPPCILKPKMLWSGKQIFSLLFRANKRSAVKVNLEAKGKSYTEGYRREFCPNESYVIIRNSQLIAGTMDKSHLGSGGKCNNVFYNLLRDFGEYGEEYSITSMWRLARMSSCFLMNSGISIGIGDVTPNQQLVRKKRNLVRDGYTQCDDIITQLRTNSLKCHPGCTPEETLESECLQALSKIREDLGMACVSELPSTNSPLIMTLSGSKGSSINIAQMVTCVGQQALSGKRVPDGFEDRSLPHFLHNSKTPDAKGFVENSFYSGLIPTEFIFHTMGGREGLVDTAVKTAETGYMQRRLVKTLEDLVVQYDNTVRNAENHVVQLQYGGDGLDPSQMEGSAEKMEKVITRDTAKRDMAREDLPFDFERVLRHVQARVPFRGQAVLKSREILKATELFFETREASVSDGYERFKSELMEFIKKVANRVDMVNDMYGNLPVAQEIERLTLKQVVTFLERCLSKFREALIDPGTAVGALAAQSIGEPGTQMTLKTFHFAGVASMNITQGVPRIGEIINATKNISTPIITANILHPENKSFAHKVKVTLERTTLGDISTLMVESFRESDHFMKIQLNRDLIKLQGMNIKAEHVCECILNDKKVRKLKLDLRVEAVGTDVLIIRASSDKYSSKANFAYSNLKSRLENVLVCGIENIKRVVIEQDKQKMCKLFIDGGSLRSVLSTYGIDGKKTVSNDIIDVYNTLGIEAARETIISELQALMKSHSISVDYRHIRLLAAQMTHTGEVLGVTRYGLSKMKQSVLNLASFEKTADHLFDAAYYGQVDKINGVSENIIFGMPAPIGTGIFKMLHQTLVEEEDEKVELLFETAASK